MRSCRRLSKSSRWRGRVRYHKLDQPEAKEDEAMSDLPTKILVATDGSAGSVKAARRAAGMAHAFGAELHVVHVMPVTQPYHLVGADAEGPSMYEEDLQWAQELLDGQVSKIEEEGAKVTKAYLRTGEPDAEVVL